MFSIFGILKNSKKIIVSSVFSLCLVVGFFGSFSCADDLLMKAFQEAHNHSTVIDLGATKDAVGYSVTEGRTTFHASVSSGFTKDKGNSLLVTISKILLKFVIVLSVTMIIYNAIFYASKVIGGEDYKSKAALKQLGLVALGIVLALSSIAIINLIKSASSTFLGIL